MLTDDQILELTMDHGYCEIFDTFADISHAAKFARAIEAAAIAACAAECEARHANGNRKHLHPDDCAAALREMKTC